MAAPDFPVSAAADGPAARLGGLALALAVTALLAPVLAYLAIRSKLATGRVFEGSDLVGRGRAPFRRLRFAGDGRLAGLPALFNLVRGDMAWVGPRPLSLADADGLPSRFERRFNLRPGLMYPQAVRRNVGIAYDDENRLEDDFFFGERPGSRLGLALRFGLSRLLSGGPSRPLPPSLDFFGVSIANVSMAEALDWIADRCRRRTPSLLAFVNPDCLNIAHGHEDYRAVLARAARVLPDGIGIKLGCRILGVELRENVNGTDLFPRLCERSAAEGFRLYLLGARPGVAAAAAAAMVARFPGLIIAGARDGYFAEEDTPAVIAAINRANADILLVAFGAPRQELWLARHSEELAPPVRMGVGGLFDFYSGRIPRAPLWMREIGMEWVFRLMQEPGRMWRRYLVGNPVFLYRVWRQRSQGVTHDQTA